MLFGSNMERRWKEEIDWVRGKMGFGLRKKKVLGRTHPKYFTRLVIIILSLIS